MEKQLFNRFSRVRTNHFYFKKKSIKFISPPSTKTQSAGKNDPEVGRLPILRHCCCSHGVSELTSDGWLLYIFSLYSTTCFSGCFSDYGFYHVSDNVHYVTPVHLSWTTLEQKSRSKLQ